jgi:hypothetical protein
MKKFLSWTLAAVLVVGMPSLATAARRHRLQFSGEVTDAKTTTITVKGSRIETIDVPSSTTITGASGISDLVGKHVTVKEKSPGIAKEIIVHTPKKAVASQSTQ